MLPVHNAWYGLNCLKVLGHFSVYKVELTSISSHREEQGPDLPCCLKQLENYTKHEIFSDTGHR